MITAVTGSPEDTRQLACALGQLSEPGDVILLAGGLGTGKTTFVQGFGRALGVDEPITSPTFTLVRTYQGRMDLVHVDLYRLDRLDEVEELGVAELLDGNAVALVEWGDVASSVFSREFLEVQMEMGGLDTERLIRLGATGKRWVSRCPGIHVAVEPWRRPA